MASLDFSALGLRAGFAGEGFLGFLVGFLVGKLVGVSVSSSHLPVQEHALRDLNRQLS